MFKYMDKYCSAPLLSKFYFGNIILCENVFIKQGIHENFSSPLSEVELKLVQHISTAYESPFTIGDREQIYTCKYQKQLS